MNTVAITANVISNICNYRIVNRIPRVHRAVANRSTAWFPLVVHVPKVSPAVRAVSVPHPRPAGPAVGEVSVNGFPVESPA
jgi:hypothetical protein